MKIKQKMNLKKILQLKNKKQKVIKIINLIKTLNHQIFFKNHICKKKIFIHENLEKGLFLKECIKIKFQNFLINNKIIKEKVNMHLRVIMYKNL